MTLRRPSLRLKISPEDRRKLMSLPPAQRRAHLHFALIIWADALSKDPSLTFQERLQVLRTFARLITK